jgi:hypothetical protein
MTQSLRALRRPTVQAWLGAVLVTLLLLAQAFATTHRLDSAAHANGESCNICLSVASLGAGAVAQVVEFGIDVSHPTFVAIDGSILVSTVPTRRSARGPPVASLKF